jgi:hypothetical protein
MIPRISPLSLLFLTCLSIAVSVRAATLNWLDNNRFELTDYGLTLQRPGSAWRVIEGAHPRILEMVFHRGAGKIIITVDELPPLHASYSRKKPFMTIDGVKASPRARELIVSYETSGLQFFEVRELASSVFAAATDAERRLYFFHFQMVKRRDHNVPVAIVMGIPRELYHEFYPQFLSLILPLADWSRQSATDKDPGTLPYHH